MFKGHYGPAFAVKVLHKSPSLTACFVAVQQVDIGFFPLADFGIEKWRPNLAITGIIPVDPYYLPFTHSRIGSAAWFQELLRPQAVLLPAPGATRATSCAIE
jgi:hypothetical protein